MYIGKIAEVRFTRSASGTLSKDAFDQLVTWVHNFNKRGGGSFKMCVQPTRNGVTTVLHDELAAYFKPSGIAVANLLEFRINFVEVDDQGLAWEGFGIQNGSWTPLTK